MNAGRRRSGLMLAGLMIFALLSGCRQENPFQIDPAQVQEIWMDTWPGSMDSVRFTDDEAQIGSIAAYINGLKLRASTAHDQQLAGRSIGIEITLTDGTVREFYHSANAYFSEEGKPGFYVMNKKQGEAFGTEIYDKMPAPMLRTGIVREKLWEKNGRIHMLVDLVPDAEGLLGGETVISVAPQRIVQTGSMEHGQVNVGDEIGLYLQGAVALTQPPLCGAWKLYVRKEAQAGD